MRIIINADDTVDADMALQRVQMVVAEGVTSNSGTQYAYVTVWPDIEVLADKTPAGTFVFRVRHSVLENENE